MGREENGELLQLASNDFDVFITAAQRLSYQQDVARFSIAVVVLEARRNKIEFLLPLIPELRRVLEEVQHDKVYRKADEQNPVDRFSPRKLTQQKIRQHAIELFGLLDLRFVSRMLETMHS